MPRHSIMLSIIFVNRLVCFSGHIHSIFQSQSDMIACTELKGEDRDYQRLYTLADWLAATVVMVFIQMAMVTVAMAV